MTVGLQLNNPGNLEYNDHDKWQGLHDPPREGKFFWFENAVKGIRAIARVLITKQDKYNLRTINSLICGGPGGIGAYAPAVDHNDTTAYVADVCRRTGLTASQLLDLHSYEHQRLLLPAIIWHEQGSMPYSDAQIDEALKLAGVVPIAPTSTTAALAKDPKVIAASIAGTAATVQATVSSVSDIWDTLGQHIDPRYLVWSCVAVVVGFGIWYALQKLKARKEGIG